MHDGKFKLNWNSFLIEIKTFICSKWNTVHRAHINGEWSESVITSAIDRVHYYFTLFPCAVGVRKLNFELQYRLIRFWKTHTYRCSLIRVAGLLQSVSTKCPYSISNQNKISILLDKFKIIRCMNWTIEYRSRSCLTNEKRKTLWERCGEWNCMWISIENEKLNTWREIEIEKFQRVFRRYALLAHLTQNDFGQ